MKKEAEENGGYRPPGRELYERDEINSEPESMDIIETKQGYPEEPQEYVPAETWDGLEHMGHKTSRDQMSRVRFEGHWADLPPKPEDLYEA